MRQRGSIVPPSARDYYAALSRGYEEKIRQLVPKYDDMVDCIADLVAAGEPVSVLDVGAGTGTVTRRLLERLPSAQLTALDASAEMTAAARVALSPYGERVRVVTAELAAFRPERAYDAVVSNLVLHNVPYPEKAAVLATIVRWLAADGLFVWGDYIRHDDPRVDQLYLRERIAFARAAGCPEDLIEANFAKETEEDAPLTIAEATELARDAGFDDIDVVWAHDAFAVLALARSVAAR